jgi:hypothetical protein
MSTNASAARESAGLLPADVLKRLATSESGFVFDPVSGDSFTANATALAILRIAQAETDPRRIAERLAQEFDVGVAEAERETIEFAGVLRRALG